MDVIASSSSTSSQLDQLCYLLEHASNLEKVETESARLLDAGELNLLRALLDAAEMRLGPWLAGTEGGSSANNNKAQLGAVHLLVLLGEDDLPAAKMLLKRLGGGTASSPVIQRCAGVYEKLWNGETVAAIELAISCKQDPQFAQAPLALKALEQFIARIRTRQLQLLQRAYSGISVEAFGRALGFSSMAEVQQFCNWSPHLFEVRDGYVLPKPAQPVSTEDVAAQIEKLTKLIVFLESDIVTFINPKNPATAAAGSSQQ